MYRKLVTASLPSDEKQARRIGEARHEESILQQRQESKNVTLDNLFEQMKQGEMKDLNIIIKGDVQGLWKHLLHH